MSLLVVSCHFYQIIWFFLPIFFTFDKFWQIFCQKMPKLKNSFFVAFSFIGKHPIYIPNFRKFHQKVWILSIFFIFDQNLLFFGQKKTKNANIKIGLCGFIYYWGIKFLKISSNSSQDNLWQTCGWTHKGESIGPFGLQPGTKKKITDRNKMLYTGIESFYW